jgi:hypothetical protein
MRKYFPSDPFLRWRSAAAARSLAGIYRIARARRLKAPLLPFAHIQRPQNAVIGHTHAIRSLR